MPGTPNIMHISPKEFIEMTFKLGRILYEAGIRPKHTISVWRGGTPVGLGVDAFYRMRGFFMNHTTIATESYRGINQQGEVIVKGLEHVIKVVCPEDDLLIIDDVYESGHTIEAIVTALRRGARANMPRNIYVATLQYKPHKVDYKEFPVYYVEKIGDVWIDYPHELSDLVAPDGDDSLVKKKDEAVWKLLHDEVKAPGQIKKFNDFNYLYLDDIRRDAVKLGLLVAREHKFFPDFLIALWPGGVNAGLAVHEVYKYLYKMGEVPMAPDHVSINTTRTHLTYKSNIIGVRYLEERIERHHKILLIDTAFKSGRIMTDVIAKLKESLRRNLSLGNVKVATVYYNPEDDSTWRMKPIVTRPDFYACLTDRTLVYPQNIYRLPSPHRDLRKLHPELWDIIYG